MKTTKNIALVKFVLLLFLGLGIVPLHATTTLNDSQTALRFEPLANVIRLSDDVAIAGSTYTKLGTIEDVYVTENNLSKLKTVEIYKSADGVLAWRALAQGVDDILWTNIDEFDGLLNGKMVTYYDVNVTYQSSRVRAGMAFEEGDVLHFDINLPTQIQGQGVSSEIFQRAITDYSPSKVEGLWKSSGNYLGGESVNLTIFKQKVAEGLTDIQAVFETPTGKILKTNGFDGVPTILINTSDEVKVLFNPTN